MQPSVNISWKKTTSRTIPAFYGQEKIADITASNDWQPAEGAWEAQEQLITTGGEAIQWFLDGIDNVHFYKRLTPDVALRVAVDLVQAALEYRTGEFDVGYSTTESTKRTRTTYSLMITALPANENWNLEQLDTAEVINPESEEAEIILQQAIWDFRASSQPLRFDIEVIDQQLPVPTLHESEKG